MIKGFFGFIAALGLYFAIFGIYFIFEGYGARSWPVVEGTIVSTRVLTNTLMQQQTGFTESRREARRTYYPEITYRWTVDGQTHTGSRFALGESHPDFKERQVAREAAQRFPAGQSIDVYIDPEDPSSAVIDRSLKLGAFVPLPVGLLFLALGVFGLRMAPILEAASQRGVRPETHSPGPSTDDRKDPMKTMCAMLVLLAALPGFAQDVSILDLNTAGIPLNPYTYFEPDHPTLAGRLVFNAGSDDGDELWFTDGTGSGTSVEDLVPGPTSSYPKSFTKVGARVFFLASTPASGQELWTTLGPGQTSMVADLLPGPLSSGIRSLTSFDGDLFFTASDAVNRGLYTADSASALLTPVATHVVEPAYSTEIVDDDTRIYFKGSALSGGSSEIWASDGTGAGTEQITDLGCPSWGEFLGVGASVFVVCDEGSSTKLLALSPGSPSGTVLVHDFGDQTVDRLTPAGGNLYMVIGDEQIWRLDSSTGMASQTTGFDPGASPDDLFRHAGDLLFTATAVNGRELFWTDGLLVGEINIFPGQPGSYPADLRFHDGHVYFTADDGTHGRELWTTNGTAAGTSMVVDLEPGSSGSEIELGPSTGFGLVFKRADRGLWLSDGTETGTVEVPLPGSLSASPTNLYLDTESGKLYFVRDRGSDDGGLWRTDGTAAGTELVAVTAPGSNRQPGNLIVSGAYLYFAAADGAARDEIWRSDGTAAGTELVADINPGSQGSNPRDLVPAVGLLFFSADDGVHGRELWRTDGTAAGTVLVGDMHSGPEDSDAEPVAELAGGLVFKVRRHDDALYFTDGTPGAITPIMQADFINISRYSPVWNNHIYFVARHDATDGKDLWRTDGTAAGTENLQLEPGDRGSDPRDLAAGPEHLYLSAYDLVAKREIHILEAPLFSDDFESGETSAC